MASADRELTILLKLLADTAGATQVRAQLTALQAEQQKLQTQASSIGATELSTTQATAAAQQVLNGIMERRVIMETQLEAAEARIAGNPAMASKLEREVAIRTQALNIQRTLNVTTEESIALSERMVIAQEAGAVATNSMGINFAKMRQEAIVLGREMAVGNVRASTLSSLLGSLGTSLTIAGIAGYELFQGISHAGDATLTAQKANEKMAGDIHNAVLEWDELAQRAQDFGDTVKLGAKIKSDLDKIGAENDELRKSEIDKWARFLDILAGISVTAASIASKATLGLIPSIGTNTFQGDLDKAKADAQKKLNDEVRIGNVLQDEAIRKTKEWAAAEANLPQGLADFNAKLNVAEATLAHLDAARHQDPTNAAALKAYEDQLARVQSLRQAVNQLGDEYDKAQGEAKRAATQQLNAELRAQAALLTDIRQQQQLISANPFLSADQKQALSLALLNRELSLLGQTIARDKDQIEHSILDPVQSQRLQAQLQNDQFELEMLKLKIQALNQPLSAELFNWVNSFGTQAHQVAGLIEGTINASLEGTNQLLLNAAFRTGDWQQTVVGVERQIENLFLTFIEHQIESFILGETHKATSTATSITAAGAQLSAQAPLAAATSISSYGSAAIVGEIAAVAAIAAIIAALSGAFKTGGLTGTNQIARVGEEGPEFVFTHRATENVGAANLYRFMRYAESAPRFGEGGVMRYPGLFPGNDIEPRWLPGADLPDDFFGRTGTGPIVDLGFGERPIFHWPYGGPNQSGYIVQSGIDIYPGDDDVPDVPPVVASNPYGLPVDPGADPGPGLFPRPPGGVTIIPTAGYRPGGYAATPNYIGNFGGNFSLPFFPGWSGLGYGTRPPVEAGSVFTQNNPPTYNSSLGIWQQWDPVAQTMIQAPPPTRFDPGFIDPATGLVIAPSSTRDPSGGQRTVNPTSVGGGAGAAPSIGTHWDFTQGRYVANNNATGAQFNSQAANALMMWYQSMGGVPNLAQPDVPSSFQSGVWQLDPESGAFTQVGDRSARDPRWVLPSQSESARLGLSFTNNANKYNDWLIAHNPWFYDQIPGGADGARIPGPASRADNILSWLSTGERVIPADRNIMLERAFGFDWDRKLEVAMPRFANGGRVARGAMASASGAPAEGDVHVYIFDDRRKAQHAYEESPHARKVFRDRLNRYS